MSQLQKLPLIGLQTIIEREGCRSITMYNTDGKKVKVFNQVDQQIWSSGKKPDHIIDTFEIVEEITEGFGTRWSLVECLEDYELITFEVKNGKSIIKRTPVTSREGYEVEGRSILFDLLGIKGRSRRAKLQQAEHFVNILSKSIKPKTKDKVRILDLACGRSYVGFSSALFFMAQGVDVELDGLEYRKDLVDQCILVAEKLNIKGKFMVGDLNTFSVQENQYDIILALHACDTLSDEVIRIALESKTKHVFFSPCCHRELDYKLKDHSLNWIASYSLLHQQLAEVLTDSFRCLVLEVYGYKVSTVRFADRDLTPKNLFIVANLQSSFNNNKRKDALAFLHEFNVQPRLANLLHLSN